MLPLPCDNGTDGFDPHIPPDDKESLGSVHAMVNHAEEQLGWIIQHQVKELLAGPMLTLLPSHRKTVPVRGKVGPNTTNIPPLTSCHLSTPGPAYGWLARPPLSVPFFKHVIHPLIPWFQKLIFKNPVFK